MRPMGHNSIKNIIKNVAEFNNLDLKEYSGHTLRKTAVNLLVNANCNDTQLRAHFNWKNSDTSNHYINTSLSQIKKRSLMISNNWKSNKSIYKEQKYEEKDEIDIPMINIEQDEIEKKQQMEKFLPKLFENCNLNGPTINIHYHFHKK